MFAATLIYFVVTAEVSDHNVKCSAEILAENEEAAVSLMKTRLVKALDGFIGAMRRQRKQSFDIPVTFWDSATIVATPAATATVVRFNFDRVRTDDPMCGTL